MEATGQMPFVEHLPFSLSDFSACARTGVVWTDRAALEALDALACRFPKGFSVRGGFRRPREQVYPLLSRHHLGRAFDLVGSNALRRAALSSGLFLQVLPAFSSAGRVRVEGGGFRTRLGRGSQGADVMALQDALNCLGLGPGCLNGVFCRETAEAVRRLQAAFGLQATGCMDFPAWLALSRSIDKRGLPCENRTDHSGGRVY